MSELPVEAEVVDEPKRDREFTDAELEEFHKWKATQEPAAPGDAPEERTEEDKERDHPYDHPTDARYSHIATLATGEVAGVHSEHENQVWSPRAGQMVPVTATAVNPDHVADVADEE